MGKRKKRPTEQEAAAAAPAEQPDRFRKRLDLDVLAYFHEIRNHYDSLDSESERSLVADNCLREALKQPLQVATDAECSRIMEVLLASASAMTGLALVEALLEGDTWLTVSTKCALCRTGPNWLLLKGRLSAHLAVALQPVWLTRGREATGGHVQPTKQL